MLKLLCIIFLLDEIGIDTIQRRRKNFLRTIKYMEVHGILHYTEEWATK